MNRGDNENNGMIVVVWMIGCHSEMCLCLCAGFAAFCVCVCVGRCVGPGLEHIVPTICPLPFCAVVYGAGD